MKHIRLVVAGAVVVAGLVAPAAAGSAAYLSSPVTGSNGHGFAVSLSSPPGELVADQTAHLMATSNLNVKKTGYSIDIVRVVDGKILAACTTGKQCTASTSEISGVWTYVAEIARPDGKNVQIRSKPSNVAWRVPSTTAGANRFVAATDQPIQLQALGSVDFTGTSFAIRLFDAETGRTIKTCSVGWNCFANVVDIGFHEFDVEIIGPPIPPFFFIPMPVNVAWPSATIRLTAGAPTTTAGRSVKLTATASVDVGPTPYAIRIIETTSAIQRTIASCGVGSTCSVSVSSAVAATHSYIAEIAETYGTRTFVPALSASTSVGWIPRPTQ